jgi:simple sugar transport system permease protein
MSARQVLESIALPTVAAVAAFGLFGVFLAAYGKDPLAVYGLMVRGAFGTAFSWENTLTRAAPLMLTALATALPARAGLVVIGGEGSLALGGLAAAVAGVALHTTSAIVALPVLLVAGCVVGGLWLGLAGWLRQRRGVNETISSLLLGYLAAALLNHLVEGPFKDPATLNKPSTGALAEAHLLGGILGTDVHQGLLFGVVACAVAWVVMCRSSFGFAVDMAGGNLRTARLCGLPVDRLVITTCCAGGAAAGLAGAIEVAAVHGRANASLMAGYGTTGILVAFLARHHPLAIIPVAILMGGIVASGGLLQRRLQLPDATVLVLQGLLFVCLLAAESLRGRLPWLKGTAHVR